MCIYIDQMRFQKLSFLWISTIDSVFQNLIFVAFLWRFCADQCEHFHKNGGFFSTFVQKRSSVTGAQEQFTKIVVNTMSLLKILVAFRLLCGVKCKKHEAQITKHEE